MTTAAAAVERLLGTRARVRRALSATVSEVELADGTVAVAKRGQGAGATRTEAASLRWLAEPATVRLPEVLGTDEYWLVISRVPTASPSGAAELGAALAGMHDAGTTAFGTGPPGAGSQAWIGNTTLPAGTGRSWPRWYAERRVLPYLRASVDARVMAPSGARAVEAVCERIEELAGPPEPPSRLHGDLWSGNVLWCRGGGAYLVDPSAHGGHRETDLAMLHLFGCPQLDAILDGYQHRRPLADGWRERIPLHQLFPLLVHTVLFGGGYGGQAETAAVAALRQA